MTPGNDIQALEASMPKSIDVRGYNVKKLPLGAYFKLVSRLNSIPKDFLRTAIVAWNDIDASEEAEAKIDNNVKFFDIALKLVSKFPEEVLNIASESCGVLPEDMEADRDLGLDGFADVLVAIWKVNDLENVYADLKKKLPEGMAKYLVKIQEVAESASTS